MSNYHKFVTTGGRGFIDGKLLDNTLVHLLIVPEDHMLTKTLVVHGGCRGADYRVQKFCEKMGIHTFECRALWDSYGRGAGPIRNAFMLKFIKPECLIAFPGGTGTESCVRAAEFLGIPVVRATELRDSGALEAFDD